MTYGEHISIDESEQPEDDPVPPSAVALTIPAIHHQATSKSWIDVPWFDAYPHLLDPNGRFILCLADSGLYV